MSKPYRILYDVRPLSNPVAARVIEADAPWEALHLANAPLKCVVQEYQATMRHACLCSDQATFTNIEYPAYPGTWRCSNCGEDWLLPPDQINWHWEENYASGYVPCRAKTHENCGCYGLGWVKQQAQATLLSNRASRQPTDQG